MNMHTKAIQLRRDAAAKRSGKVSIGHRLALSASRGGDEWLDPQGVALCFTGTTKRRRSIKSCAAKAAAALAAFFGVIYVTYYHFGHYLWKLLP